MTEEKIADVVRKLKQNNEERKGIIGRFDRQEDAIKSELDSEMVGSCLIDKNWNGSKEGSWEVVRIIAPCHRTGSISYRAIVVPYVIEGKAELSVRLTEWYLDPDRTDLLVPVENDVFATRLHEALRTINGIDSVEDEDK